MVIGSLSDKEDPLTPIDCKRVLIHTVVDGIVPVDLWLGTEEKVIIKVALLGVFIIITQKNEEDSLLGKMPFLVDLDDPFKPERTITVVRVRPTKSVFGKDKVHIIVDLSNDPRDL